MAIVWGAEQTSSNNGFKLGYETSQSGKTLTIKFYVNTKYSIDDVNNTFVAYVGNTCIYNGKVTIKTTSNSGGWASVNTVLLTSGTSTTSGTISFSASLTGIDIVGSSKKATVSGSAENWTYTEIGSPTVTITDNYNNTFTITAVKGANGTNNPVVGLDTLTWGYNTNYSNSYYSGVTKNLTISGTGSTRTVYARARNTSTYGSAKVTATSKAIKQYKGPNQVSGYKLTYTKSRLTMKEDWKISWETPSKNNSCPIKGYRIRLQRKRGTNDWVNLPIFGSTGTLLGNGVYYDRGNIQTSLHIYTQYYTNLISPGDKIRFSVNGYTKYGENYDGNQLFSSSETYSDEYTVENAGIVHVKTSDGAWVEGQVNVYVDNKWVEAESIKVLTNSGVWAEAN